MSSPPDVELIKAMWASAWRTALGVLMSLGVVQAMVVFLANALPPKESSGVLVAIRIMQALSLFSQAPFYTKIPEMNGFALSKGATEVI